MDLVNLALALIFIAIVAIIPIGCRVTRGSGQAWGGRQRSSNLWPELIGYRRWPGDLAGRAGRAMPLGADVMTCDV